MPGEEKVLSIELIWNKLTKARTQLLLEAPFYGTLLMHLRFTLAKCETAATDMHRIIWDPRFVSRLSTEEIEFVMMHEVLHCALFHCGRGKELNQHFFNIAADIVVNSTILHTRGLNEMIIAGEPAMHLAPDGKEGYIYTAEQVYDMLMVKYNKLIDDVDQLLAQIEKDYGVTLDSHDIWEIVPLTPSLEDEWKKSIIDAVEQTGHGIGESIPGIRELIEKEYKSSVNWKAVLHDFIQVIHDKYDFTFVPYDRRMSESDFFLPAFNEIEQDAVKNLLFMVDTSGSIDTDTLSNIMSEIRAAIEQFERLEAKLGFFDTRVTKPQSFDSVDSLKKILPVGGGGTSFRIIFNYIRENMLEDLPTAVIILTDGQAHFPSESETMGIPVLWIYFGNSNDAPWGTTVHIDTTK